MNDSTSGPIDETVRRTFESALSRGKPLQIEDCLPSADAPHYLGTLEELVLIEMEFAAKRGDARPVEGYVQRFKELDRPDILERLHEQNAAVSKTHAFAPGQQIGRYRLVSEHARGGFGSVWRAIDGKLDRVIALKQLSQRSAADAETRERFVHEAKLTARLEHPGVVPVYDMASLDAEPFFYAMKLVHGKTLAEAIDHMHGLEDGTGRVVEQRQILSAFLVVCQSMEYAHAAGIVHRDLKPNNIVLSDYGETVILDWGLAKANEDEDAGNNGGATVSSTEVEQTLPGTVKGTPTFMSPEQAAGLVDHIDQQSDVYSLGVILYQILTGRLPFHGETSDEVIEKVIQASPHKPRAVNSSIHPALEAITLRAMAKDRAERYSDAGALTRDLQHYLADEPVSVYRESLSMRFGRFGRRHRALVTGLATAVVLVVVALAVIASVLSVSNESLRKANQRERQAKDQAQANLTVAKQAVQRYFTAVSESPRLRKVGLEPLRRELLFAATDFYQRLADQKSDDTEIMHEQAEALTSLAVIRAETVSVEAAAKPTKQAQRILRTLIARHPEVPGYVDQLANTHSVLSGVLRKQRRYPEAKAELEQALAVLENPRADLGTLEYQRSRVHHNLATVCADSGQLSDADNHYRKALTIRERGLQERRPHAGIELAMTHQGYGNLMQNLRRPEAAAASLERAVELCRKLNKDNPDETRYQALLAVTTMNWGIHLARQKRPGEAEQAYGESAKILKALIANHPGVQSYLESMTAVRTNLGGLLYSQGNHEKAQAQLERARDLRQALRILEPSDPLHVQLQANIQRNLAHSYQLQKDYFHALVEFENAATIDEELLERFPKRALHAINLGKSLYGAARASYYLTDKESALALADEAIVLADKWLPKPMQPGQLRELRSNLGYLVRFRAPVLEQFQRYKEAAADWGRAAELFEDASERAKHTHRQARALGRAGDGAAALRFARRLSEEPPTRAYDAAVLYALAATAGIEGKDQHAATAVKELQRAADAGWFGSPARRAALEREMAFKVLASRVDYLAFRKRSGL